MESAEQRCVPRALAQISVGVCFIVYSYAPWRSRLQTHAVKASDRLQITLGYLRLDGPNLVLILSTSWCCSFT